MSDIPRPATGQSDVDAALAALDDVAELPVAEQLERLAATHEALHRALALDAAQQ